MNWQTIIALACVFATLAVFVYRLTRPKDKDSCGGGCGCGHEKRASPIPPPTERH